VVFRDTMALLVHEESAGRFLQDSNESERRRTFRIARP
jgi:hypothetical protein